MEYNYSLLKQNEYRFQNMKYARTPLEIKLISHLKQVLSKSILPQNMKEGMKGAIYLVKPLLRFFLTICRENGSLIIAVGVGT